MHLAICGCARASCSAVLPDNAQGRILAMDWLRQLRRSLEARDALQSVQPLPCRRMQVRWLWGRETRMTHADILTRETRPTTLIDGLEVEIFATEEEAASAWNSVPSYGEHQAAAFVAQTAHIASEQEEGGHGDGTHHSSSSGQSQQV